MFLKRRPQTWSIRKGELRGLGLAASPHECLCSIHNDSMIRCEEGSENWKSGCLRAADRFKEVGIMFLHGAALVELGECALRSNWSFVKLIKVEIDCALRIPTIYVVLLDTCTT